MLEKTFKFTWLQITKNCCELSAMISENFEITCLKWLKHDMCTNEAKCYKWKFHFFLIFNFYLVTSLLNPKKWNNKQQQN